MHHILYRITNKLNGRYYVGIHSTDNLDDGYFGSGRRIKAEIRKYGKENFEKVILEELPTRKSLKDREREIVNDSLLADPLCLNLKNGGEGGGKFWSKEHQTKCSTAGGKIGGRVSMQMLNKDSAIRAKIVATRKANGSFATFGMLGKIHSTEAREK